MKALDYRKLPPLKALKGFESTARLQSFRKAAEELNLSHPAISHQIQALEDNLGTKLFSREGRHAVLTTQGAAFYQVVREALTQLISGSESLRLSQQQPSLTVQTYISVSLRWLCHRLPRFRVQHPNYQLHLLSSIEEQDFDEANADIGLIFCRRPPKGHLYWQTLIKPQLIAVCSPELLKNQQQTLRPLDLLNCPLLSITSEAWQWQDWFDAAGVDSQLMKSTISVDSTAIAIELAMDGVGIALVNGPFADRELNAGRLVKATDHYVEGLGEWGLVCRKEKYQQAGVQDFMHWLTADVLAQP